MNGSSFWIVVIALILGVLAAISGLALLRLRTERNTTQMPGGVLHTPTVFLFNGRELRDATEPARQLLAQGNYSGTEWQQLLAWIDAHIPQATGVLSAEAQSGHSECTAYVESLGLELRLSVDHPDNDVTRVTLTPASPVPPDQRGILSQSAHEEELAFLRDALDNAPTMIWRQDSSGRITWANATYKTLVNKIAGEDCSGETLPRLLGLPENDTGPSRARLSSGDETLWFDCEHRNIGDAHLFFATPADNAVHAERFLREFVQTLTRTFATLNTGFAIFDRQRNLQLFNPAIIELTGLSAEFLATRPTLADFLDRLRELRMVPEPKDYPTWRGQINNLESAAASGHHLEKWALPGGRVFRVQGSPHPDGAIAFLFEEISSEMAIQHKYREELALNKAVLDRIDDALAVFGPDGKLVLCNSTYRDTWSGEKSTAHDSIRHWQSLLQVGSELGALRRCLISGDMAQNRTDGRVTDLTGSKYLWTVSHISGRHRMVRFQPIGSQSADQSTDS